MQLRGNQLRLQSEAEIFHASPAALSTSRDLREQLLRSTERPKDKILSSNKFSIISGQLGCTFIDTSNSEVMNIEKSKPGNRIPCQKSDVRYMQMMDRFVQGIEHENQELSPHKMKILKQLLEHCNVKHFNQRNYEKLANTFGLRIHSVKYEQLPRKRDLSFQKPSTAIGIRTRKKIHKIEINDLTGLKVEDAASPRQTIREKPRSLTRQVDFSRAGTSEPKARTRFVGSQFDSFEIRLKKFRQFLFMINLSNQVYRKLDFSSYIVPIKMFIGPGNNSNLIRSLMKKRFWFVEVTQPKDANFIWTQIKIDSIFSSQPLSEPCHPLNPSAQPKKVRNRQISHVVRKKGARQHEPNQPLLKILNLQHYIDYRSVINGVGIRKKEDFDFRLKFIRTKPRILEDPSQLLRIHNHLPNNGFLGNKKALFYCLREYYSLTERDVFQTVPLTFHIQNGTRDEQFKKLLTTYNDRKKTGKPNIWIIKPGEFTNRGNGISCSNKIDNIRKIISTCRPAAGSKAQRTFIVQSYLTRPLLYNRRKFDIRAYMLITMNGGCLKGYWYQQGYIRTSSQIFDLDDLDDNMIHLTNDAVQKNGEDYGAYEPGNKITYNDLQRYLDGSGYKVDFYSKVYPEMRRIASECVASASLFLDPDRRSCNFEIFGLDFMVDEDFRVWLIQVNTNPCLQLCCGILQRLIPSMVENALRIGLDPNFPPPSVYPPTKKYNISQNALFHNKFELIFDELRDGPVLYELYANNKLRNKIGNISEDKDQYADEGKLIDDLTD